MTNVPDIGVYLVILGCFMMAGAIIVFHHTGGPPVDIPGKFFTKEFLNKAIEKKPIEFFFLGSATFLILGGFILMVVSGLRVPEGSVRARQLSQSASHLLHKFV